jgi:hypothetical protein
MHSIRKHHLAALMIVWLLVHILLFWHFGVRSLFDSIGYIRGADFLLQHGTVEDTHHIFYAIPIGFMAFFRWLFPEQIVPFLIFQSILSGVATLALYRSALKIFNNHLAGFLASLLFLLWCDNIHWNTTAMTESLACSAACFLLFLLTHFKGTLKDYCWTIVLLIIQFFIRPTGVIIIVGAIAFLVWYHREVIWNSAWRYPVIAALFVAGYWSASFMFARWDFTDQYKRGNIVTYMDTIEGNPLYDESLTIEPSQVEFGDPAQPPMMKMLFFIFHNPGYFLKTAGLKVWYLLSTIRPYYSYWHNAYSILWVAFIYMMFWLGWRKANKAPIKVFIMTVILVNCGLIAISSVDWDNRFYLPMEPGLVLLAGGGAAYMMSALNDRLRRLMNQS